MQTLTSFINKRRLIIYPRLILIVMWLFVLMNIFFHNGWQGAMGGILGFDFLGNYSAGILYSKDSKLLYDVEAQARLQQLLISPTSLDGGVNIFSYPPYVAFFYQMITPLPYSWAIIIWSILSIALLVASAIWMWKELTPNNLTKSGLSVTQLLIILFSFFPMILGFQIGQNYAITLFLFTGILVYGLREKWFTTGVLAGLTIYKPQFALGLLIIWFVWKKYHAILGYSAVALIWSCLVLVTKGLQPYFDYLELVPTLLRFPYGVGGPLEVTPYALLATSFPLIDLTTIWVMSISLTIILSFTLVWASYRTRELTVLEKIPVYILALIFPFLISPHMLIYDLILLIPIFLLWSKINRSRELLYLGITIYFASLILPILTTQLKISLLAIIPIGLLIFLIHETAKTHNWKYLFNAHKQ